MRLQHSKKTREVGIRKKIVFEGTSCSSSVSTLNNVSLESEVPLIFFLSSLEAEVGASWREERAHNQPLFTGAGRSRQNLQVCKVEINTNLIIELDQCLITMK